jgi:uncharacterized protein (TIGR02246 family)
MDETAIRAWIDNYGLAWTNRDADLAATLFTEDAAYHQTPFGPHYVGTTQIREYWSAITEFEGDVVWQAGSAVIAGNGAACEWWVTMTEKGEPTTLPGCLVVTFADDGRCDNLREYWHQRDGHLAPFSGWGRLGA